MGIVDFSGKWKLKGNKEIYVCIKILVSQNLKTAGNSKWEKESI